MNQQESVALLFFMQVFFVFLSVPVAFVHHSW